MTNDLRYTRFDFGGMLCRMPPRPLLSLLFLLLILASAAAVDDSACTTQVVGKLPQGTKFQVVTAINDSAIEVLLGGAATSEVVPVTGQPFHAARRIRVKEAVSPTHLVQAMVLHLPGAVQKGDTVLVSAWIRAPEMTANASGCVSMHLQLARQPWTVKASASTIATTEWRQMFAYGKAEEDYPAGSLSVSWPLGCQRQTIDLAGLVVLDLGPSFARAALPISHVTYPGQEPNAPWRAEATQRIERFRKGDLIVQVNDADGKPVADANVDISQRRLAFGLGTFIGSRAIALNADGQRFCEHLARFNRVTTPIYWSDWGWPKKRDLYLGLAQWAHDNEFTARAHPLIYPGWSFLPAALQESRNDPAELQERILAHIREMCAAMGPSDFREYDVTNELRDLDDVHNLVGRDGVAAWFAEARKNLPPGTKLALNENTILTHTGATSTNQDIYLGWIRDLEARGQKPDVVGFQAHFDEALTSPTRVWEILDRFAATGCELQITEFDLNTLDQSAQADYTRDFLTTVFAHPAVTAFTMWGFWEGEMWRPDAALYRPDWSAKPNGLAFDSLIRSWRTETQCRTDADGTAHVRGFRGDYAISVTGNGASWHGMATLTESTTVVAVIRR